MTPERLAEIIENLDVYGNDPTCEYVTQPDDCGVPGHMRAKAPNVRNRIVTCVDCGQDGKHQGRGLCTSCFMRHYKAGTLERFQRVAPVPRPSGACGTYAGFNAHKRRGEPPCAPCRTSQRRYHKRHAYDRAHGKRRIVACEPVAAHVRKLLASGMSLRAIARQADVSPTTITRTLEGQGKSAAVATRILAVTGVSLTPRHPLDEAFVPRAGSLLRVRALLALGWRHQDMTERSGVETGCLLHQAGDLVTVRNHERIRVLYEALSMTPGPSQRTRSRAIRAGYLPPLALDDDRIDDPWYLPGLEVDEPVELDPVVVDRLIEHDAAAKVIATRAERIAAFTVIVERSRRYKPDGSEPIPVETANAAARRLGLNPGRDLADWEATA